MKKFFAIVLSVISLFIVCKYTKIEDNTVLNKKIIKLKIGSHHTLNTYKSFYGGDHLVAHFMYAYLLRQTASGETVLDCAESYRVSPDCLVYTFTIRPDAKWQDGSKLTAYDFEKTFKYMIDPKNNNAQILAFLPMKNGMAIHEGKMHPKELGVRALNENTLQITFDYHSPMILGLLARSCHAIKAEILEKYGEKWSDLDKIVCSGPFVLNTKDYNLENVVEFNKNPSFYNASKVKIDGIRMLHLSATQELKSFLAGEIDIAQDLGINEGIDWDRDRVFCSYVCKSKCGGGRFLEINYHNVDMKNNPKLREAVFYSIDREGLTKNLIKSDKPLYSVVNELNAGFGYAVKEPKRFNNYEEQKKYAKSLMQHVKLIKNEIIIIFSLLRPGDPTMLALKAMIEDSLGISVRLEYIDKSNFRTFMKQNTDYHLALVNYCCDFAALNVCEFFTKGHANNFMEFEDPQIEKFFNRAKFAASKEEFIECYDKIAQIIADNFYIIPVSQLPNVCLVRPHIKFEPAASGYIFDPYMDVGVENKNSSNTF